jgi:hypothetical protein
VKNAGNTMPSPNLEDDVQYGITNDTCCPWCGKSQDMTDEQIDDVLRAGYIFKCWNCKHEIEVESVDYDITIGLMRKES